MLAKTRRNFSDRSVLDYLLTLFTRTQFKEIDGTKGGGERFCLFRPLHSAWEMSRRNHFLPQI